MNILITGGGGFLGFDIAKKLVQKGHQVTNFSRNNYLSLKRLGIKTITGNLSSYKDLEAAFDKYDVVFHVASKVGMWGEWEDFYNTNVIGTQNVIRACKDFGVNKLIYTSTPSVVFGESDLMGVDESCPIPKNHLNHYAKSKSIAEKLVLDSNNSKSFCTVALRPHLIFGPGDKNLIPRVIESAKNNKLKIVGDGNNLVDVIYIENASNAHIKIMEHLEPDSIICGKPYFIGQKEPVKLWDFINQILICQDIPPIKKRISAKMAYHMGGLFEFAFDLFNMKKIDPPMTRFIALQLSKSHYFTHQNASNDWGFNPEISTLEALEKLNQYLASSKK